MSISGVFHPYARVSAIADASDIVRHPVVRDLLRERALRQAATIVSAIERRHGSGQQPIDEPRSREGLPPILDSLDRATDRLASYRIANMLRAYGSYLEDEQYFADPSSLLAAIFDPIPIEASTAQPPAATGFLTSPALLVIQAILYSHAEWFRTRHHEAYSAWHAYKDLGTAKLDPPLVERDRRFVAALISHQTLLRVAWSLGSGRTERHHAREVAAYDGNSLSPNYGTRSGWSRGRIGRLIAHGLARTLFAFLGERAQVSPASRHQLAAAQLLCSLCLQNRHVRRRDPRLDEIKPSIEAFAGWIAKAPNDGATSLVFCQYGRYIMRVQDAASWNKFREEHLEPAARGEAKGGPHNVTISFNRHTSRRRNSTPIATAAPKLEPFVLDVGQAGQDDYVVCCIERTIGKTANVGGTDTEILRLALAALGENDGAEQSDLPPEVKKALKRWPDEPEAFFPLFTALYRAFEVHHLSDQPSNPTLRGNAFRCGYCPTPLIGRILDLLRYAQPAAFHRLRLHPMGLPASVERVSLISRPLTLFLPRVGPGRQPERWLLARYVAAMVISLEVMLGPQRVELEFFDKEECAIWGPWIEEALRLNGHPGILRYLEQIHAERCEVSIRRALTSVVRSLCVPAAYDIPRDSCVLALDVGGTAIKCGLVPVRIESPTEGSKRLVPTGEGAQFHELPTAGQAPYKNAQAFAARLIGELEKRNWPLARVKAVGVAWPGAVRDGATPAGSSSILARFQGLSGYSSDDPRDIHELNLVAAFKAAFGGEGKGREDVVVVVLNDGDADIKATGDLLPAGGSSERVSLVLKAGTGTACGVYVGPHQVNMLAEAGKVILNLMPLSIPESAPDGPAAMPAPESYPQGMLSVHCSKRTLPAIAEALGWKAPPGAPPIDALEIGYFIARGMKVEKKKLHALAYRIGQELVFKHFAGDFDGPSSVTPDNGRSQVGIFFRQRSPSWPQGIGKARLEQLEEEARKLGFPGRESADALALHCAELAGRQLGDAIALMVGAFRCREIRLAGGAFSGATGEELLKAAFKSLRDVYGLHVGTEPERHEPDVHALSEVRKIRIIPPDVGQSPPTATEREISTGVRGAALAAIEAWVRVAKGQELMRVRAEILAARPGSEIDPRSYCGSGSVLLEEDLRALLQISMSSLELTLAPSGRYFKFDARQGRLGAAAQDKYFPPTSSD